MTTSRSKSNTLSYSKTNCFMSCRKRFFFQYNEGIVPITSPIVMSEGKTFHDIMSAVFVGIASCTTGFKTRSEVALDLLAAEQEKRYMDTPQEDLFSLVAVTESVRAMCTSPVFDRLHVEQSELHLKCTIKKGNKRVRVHGYLDGIGSVQLDEGCDAHPIILEMKRRKQINESTLAHTAFDYQSPFYSTMAKECGLGERAVLYVTVKAPSIQPKKSTPMEDRKYKLNGEPYAWVVLEDESPEQYRARVREWYAEAGTDAVVTHVDKRNASQLSLFVDDLMNTVQDMRTCQRNRYYYRNPTACAVMPCPYASICLEDTPELRSMNFVQRATTPAGTSTEDNKTENSASW